MGSIINLMTGDQLGEAVSVANQAVSGMTQAEAAAALGGSTVGESGFTQIWTFPLSGGNSWKPVSLEAQYAAQTWEYYKTMAEAAGITSFGAAASAAKTWAQGVMIGTGQGLAATGGLLSLSAPAAVAAAAPLLGVGIGVSLYESNPELWTKISQAILPWCYKDTDAVPAVVDENGQVSIAKGLVDALRQLFEDENIPIGGQTEKEASSDLFPDGIKIFNGFFLEYVESNVKYRYTCDQPGYWIYGNSSSLVYYHSATNTPGATLKYHRTTWFPSTSSIPTVDEDVMCTAFTNPYTHDGKSSYDITLSPSIARSRVNIESSDILQRVSAGAAGWTYLHGTISGGGEYPTGTSEWTGTIPQVLPEIPIIIIPETPDQPGEMVPYTPIQLPEVETPVDPSQYPVPVEIPDEPIFPWESPDPEQQPDPQAPNTWPDITPWISPSIPWQWPWDLPKPDNGDKSTDPTKAPVDDPLSRPKPIINPDGDPQNWPDTLPQPDSSPWGPDIPPSEGESPSPFFPPVPFPDLPMSDATGLIHVYNPTPAEMQSFGRWLWVTVQDAITQGQELIWNNPFDGVISVHELYATPITGAPQYIRSGFLVSDVSSDVVTSRYSSINCGSIVIPEYWRNYLDYSPYSRAYCYLPFIGIVELDCDDIVGHAVNILYHVDAFSGACIAQITVAKEGPDGDPYSNTTYQFSGNCAVEVPIAGGTQAAIRAAQINAAAWGLGSVIGGVAQALTSPSIGGAVGGVVGAITGAVQAQASVVSAKSSVQHSGSFGANFGAMGIKNPYIIIRRPIQKVVNNYNLDYGFPSHKMVQIGSCTGYIRVKEVNVISATANDTEKLMIEELLKSGVYIT